MHYDVDDSVTLTAKFINDLGAEIDPTTVTLTVVEPDGTTTVYGIAQLLHPSVGDFEKPILLDHPGAWAWTWFGDGPAPFSQTESGVLLVGGPTDGPSPWIDANDVFDGTPCKAIDEAARDYAIAHRSSLVASYVLWALTGRQFPGIFIDTVRPCRQNFMIGEWFERYDFDWWSSTRPWGACGCGVEDRCGCSGLSQIKLPGGPALLGVFEVIVDGVTLPTDAYRIDDSERLVRTDGDRWPCCQDLSLPTTELNTWSVRYAFGRSAPEAGLQAARELACELYKGAMGGDCALPKRVSTISRQGVTLAVIDPFTFFDKGRTGLYSVDLFIASVNPKHNLRPAMVMSPDVPPSRGARTGT